MFYRKYIFFLFLTVLLGKAIAQDMDAGFKMLEVGDVQNAEIFFGKLMETHPDNKTVQICYGRAIGLNGKPTDAEALFGKLLEEYPGDIEVLLNYNESMLWSRQFEKAKPLYKQLVSDFPDNFAAVLGYSNTLSNLKEYPEALKQINRALEISPGNPSALVSRKYVYLGFASQHTTLQAYDKSEEYILKIYEDFPNDKDANLNLANLYLIWPKTDKAIEVYKKMAVSYPDSTSSILGISLAHHIAGKDKLALEYSNRARSRKKQTIDTMLIQNIDQRYVQALIWNKKFKAAAYQIDSLKIDHANEPWLLSLSATLSMYKANAKSSVKSYEQILLLDSTSFDGNLGVANAYFASGRIKEAYFAAFQTLEVFDKQKDALSFVDKLNLMYSPNIRNQLSFTFDNGGNDAFANQTALYIPLGTKLIADVWYGYRKTVNTNTDYKATSNVMGAGLQYRLMPQVLLSGIFGLNQSMADTITYVQPVVTFNVALKPIPLHDLALGYKRELQNFNADLISLEIVMHNFSVNYNFGTNFNLGWYTQAMYTMQTDDNSRNLLFTSLYYSFLAKPLIKGGVNFQYVSFKDQVPSIYFSPEKYTALELFFDSRGAIVGDLRYYVSGAAGLQRVEDDPKSTLFRVELGLMYNVAGRFDAEVYGKHSNVASATAAGFEYYEYGIKLKWIITSKPLFYKKIDR